MLKPKHFLETFTINKDPFSTNIFLLKKDTPIHVIPKIFDDEIYIAKFVETELESYTVKSHSDWLSFSRTEEIFIGDDHFYSNQNDYKEIYTHSTFFKKNSDGQILLIHSDDKDVIQKLTLSVDTYSSDKEFIINNDFDFLKHHKMNHYFDSCSTLEFSSVEPMKCFFHFDNGGSEEIISYYKNYLSYVFPNSNLSFSYEQVDEDTVSLLFKVDSSENDFVLLSDIKEEFTSFFNLDEDDYKTVLKPNKYVFYFNDTINPFGRLIYLVISFDETKKITFIDLVSEDIFDLSFSPFLNKKLKEN